MPMGEESSPCSASQIVPVYAGYDPTSPSLHVGNLDLERERAMQLPVVQRREWET